MKQTWERQAKVIQAKVTCTSQAHSQAVGLGGNAGVFEQSGERFLEFRADGPEKGEGGDGEPACASEIRSG